MNYTYMQAISIGFPDVQCHLFGVDNVYEDIVWDSGAALPSKTTLDEWIAANPNTDILYSKKITVLAFRKRFTLTEKIALELASIDNPDPATPLEQRQIAATLRVIMKDLETALFIDLMDPAVISGLTLMENFNLIASGRADEIINTPIMPSERPINNYL